MKKNNQSTRKDYSKLNFITNKNIRIYPISEFEYFNKNGVGGINANSKNWYIEVNNNGKIKIFPKSILASEIEDSVWKTIDSYYNFLINKK